MSFLEEYCHLRERQWAQTAGQIEDLDEYTQVCPKRIEPCSWTEPSRSIPTGFGFGVTVFNTAIEKAAKAYYGAHVRTLLLLADLRRGRMCRRSKTHDIGVLPSRKPKVTECNQRSSPLLELPLELRTQIYDFVHSPRGIVTVSDGLRDNKFRLLGRIRLFGQHTPKCEQGKSSCSCSVRNMALALPITCRQTYTETIHYLYDSNTFCFNDSGLVLSLPGILPAKHLNTITSLCLAFDLDSLTTALRLTRLQQRTTDRSLAAVRRRNKYVEFWHFLRTTLNNLQSLLVSFNRENIWVAEDQRVCEWLLAPLLQFKKGANRSSRSSKLILFDVRFRIGGCLPTLNILIHEYRKEGVPFFLGESCDCVIDRRKCNECRNSNKYCLRNTRVAPVVNSLALSISR